jgi:hypothetical protein
LERGTECASESRSRSQGNCSHVNDYQRGDISQFMDEILDTECRCFMNHDCTRIQYDIPLILVEDLVAINEIIDWSEKSLKRMCLGISSQQSRSLPNSTSSFN